MRYIVNLTQTKNDYSNTFVTGVIRGTKTGTMLGAGHVVTTSVGMCDVDLR